MSISEQQVARLLVQALAGKGKLIVGSGSGIRPNGTVTVTDGRTSVQAIAVSGSGSGAMVAVKAADGKWYAIAQDKSVVVSDRVVWSRHYKEVKTITGSFKVLFTINDGASNRFYVGGDRPKPLEIFSIPGNYYSSEKGTLSSTGNKESDWICSIRHGTNAEVAQNISPVVEHTWQLSSPPSKELDYRGHGWWTSDLIQPVFATSENSAGYTGDGEILYATTYTVSTPSYLSGSGGGTTKLNKFALYEYHHTWQGIPQSSYATKGSFQVLVGIAKHKLDSHYTETNISINSDTAPPGTVVMPPLPGNATYRVTQTVQHTYHREQYPAAVGHGMFYEYSTWDSRYQSHGASKVMPSPVPFGSQYQSLQVQGGEYYAFSDSSEEPSDYSIIAREPSLEPNNPYVYPPPPSVFFNWHVYFARITTVNVDAGTALFLQPNFTAYTIYFSYQYTPGYKPSFAYGAVDSVELINFVPSTNLPPPPNSPSTPTPSNKYPVLTGGTKIETLNVAGFTQIDNTTKLPYKHNKIDKFKMKVSTKKFELESRQEQVEKSKVLIYGKNGESLLYCTFYRNANGSASVIHSDQDLKFYFKDTSGTQLIDSSPVLAGFASPTIPLTIGTPTSLYCQSVIPTKILSGESFGVATYKNNPFFDSIGGRAIKLTKKDASTEDKYEVATGIVNSISGNTFNNKLHINNINFTVENIKNTKYENSLAPQLWNFRVGSNASVFNLLHNIRYKNHAGVSRFYYDVEFEEAIDFFNGQYEKLGYGNLVKNKLYFSDFSFSGAFFDNNKEYNYAEVWEFSDGKCQKIKEVKDRVYQIKSDGNPPFNKVYAVSYHP